MGDPRVRCVVDERAMACGRAGVYMTQLGESRYTWERVVVYYTDAGELSYMLVVMRSQLHTMGERPDTYERRARATQGERAGGRADVRQMRGT